MPAPFKQLTREQFAALLDKIELKRKVNAVHMHHTWRPNHGQYDQRDGHRTILGMYLYHTQEKKWQDIAQHITIAPDGSIWLGRNWELPPASASGHNGNSEAGPFMFEIIGDFDEGRDPFDGEQRKIVLEVIARVQRKWDLAPETLTFHNAMSSKSCPGGTIDYDEIVAEVDKLHTKLGEPPAPKPDAKRKPAFAADTHEIAQIVEEALDALGREIPAATDPPDAELTYDEADRAIAPRAVGDPARDSGLTPDKLAALRPHLINLTMGKLSREGDWKTQLGDVDAIFAQHLPVALQKLKQGEVLRIVFFAHGGLVKESAGLEIAHKHAAWWKKNGVYPIYFVWETGLFETIGQLLGRSQQGARGFVDRISDPIIESTARALQGPRIWGGIKLAAEQACAPKDSLSGEGGARYVATRLKAFCDKHKTKKIELHAVGHSAGAVFHAHFLSTARELGLASFKTAHFLAPALRVDVFKKLLGKLVGAGKGIDQLSIFTMSKDFELDDNCFQIYRKSLLYLIYHALEPEPETHILGLEQSLRADAELQSLFGLDSLAAAAGEVILSVSPIAEGRSASTSRTHGGFDDDPPTMNSVARRILGKADADPIAEYEPAGTGARAVDAWQNQVDWPERLGDTRAAEPSWTAPAPPVVSRAALVGRKRALCIGINQYSGAPLNGCVADAEEWSRTLAALGFTTDVLRDSAATRGEIVIRLNDLVASSAAGDVIAFQFAGHGTQLPDLNEDETDGDTPGLDEAIVPYDHEQGAYLIDDDIAEIFARIPHGVNLTCFFDCCHSGTNTRFAVGLSPGFGAGARDQRPRFILATEAMKTQHKQFRERSGGARVLSSGGPDLMKNIAFSACLSHEVAWESDGHGDFTVRATGVLQQGIIGMTNEQFNQRVLAEFGVGARQRPLLDCSGEAARRGLLQSLIAPATPNMGGGAANPAPATTAETIQTLQGLIRRLQG